jgi:tetratricopeptide (TPR) repeat protein
VYYNIEDNKNALITYKQLLKLYPQSPETNEAIPVIKNIYVEEGKPSEYLDLMAANGIVVDVSEADSLSFTAPFEKYERKDYVSALDGFNQYVKNFPNGAYAIDANYYSAICCQQAKDVTGAIKGYAFVYEKGVGKFYESATLNLGRIYYLELKDYENAKKYFEGLNVNATVQENQLEALRGLVRCYYQLKQYATANKVANDLLNKKGISTDDKAIAYLVLGKSQEVATDSTAAIESFKSVAAINKTSWGAEARFELGACYFAANNLKLSEKAAMAVINETGSYDLWLTKAYILIGDIYMKKKDYFNAKATFESVASNAEIPELKAEAQRKYDEAVALEKKSSKIN